MADTFTEVHRQAMPRPRATVSATPMSAADGHSMMVAKAAAGLRNTGGFNEPEERRFGWERTYSRDEWLDQLPTTGTLTQAPPDQLEQILARVGAAIDAVGGSFTAQ